MRTNKNEIAEYKHDDNNKNASFDLVFAKKRDLIRSKRKQHGIDIDRYNEENNKYNLIIEQSITNKRTDNGTFLESICLSINTNHGIDDQAAVKLNEFCYNNEYDTDSIECDLNDTIGSGSNLANFLDNKLCIDLIRQCIHITKLSKTSFSTGFSFIYEEKNATHPSYLYVASTYNSIKEEVLFSGLVTASQWDDIILKAQELHTTEKVKYINNKHRSYRQSLLASHLISLTLYCDWSDLCTHFSSTFRKSNVFESIESVQKRHSKYAHIGKKLVESVCIFGKAGQSALRFEQNAVFYCGLSCVLNISSFAISFKGPCSTSRQVEVALNFAKRDGLILQLKNDGDGQFVRFFDCEWVSNYAEEDERLFISSKSSRPLRLQSVHIIEGALNYKDWFHALYLLDAWLSGVKISIKLNSKDVSILSKLIDGKVNGTSPGVDKYICDCFDLFCYQKKRIHISINYLDKYFEDLNHYIIHSIVDHRLPHTIKNYHNPFPGIDTTQVQDENINLLKPQIFKMFPNLDQISVSSTTSMDECSIYSFSLLSFLSFIQACKPSITYAIFAKRKRKPPTNGYYVSEEVTWLDNILTSSIKQIYNSHGWNISYRSGYGRDFLKISTMI